VRPSAIIEVHGYAKQSSGYGYSGVRDLNALLATVTTQQAAPVVVAQRLRGVRVGRRAARNAWSPTRWRP
jgi:NAD(P)H-nitrite reductase large subunit